MKAHLLKLSALLVAVMGLGVTQAWAAGGGVLDEPGSQWLAWVLGAAGALAFVHRRLARRDD